MARLTDKQRLQRVVDFFTGLHHPDVRRALAARGFTPAERTPASSSCAPPSKPSIPPTGHPKLHRIPSLPTLLSRIGALETGSVKQRRARELLVRRGLTEQVLDEAKTLLGELTR